jgi:iron complex outermembrane recepter protein
MINFSVAEMPKIARPVLTVMLAALSIAPAHVRAQVQAQPQAQTQSGLALEEITVTAQRREERLQDVPVAVTAFSGAQLADQNFTSAEDLAKLTPGLLFPQSTFSPEPQIRGVGSRSVSIGEESDVPIYMDGVYNPYMVANNFQLNSVDRIEVLKGPQGALYGRNSTGGAINVVTLDPSAGFQESSELSYGSYNQVTGKIYVGGGTDTIAANLSMLRYHMDGYNRNLYTNGSTVGGDDSYNLRGKLLFHPRDDLTFTLIGSLSHDDNKTAEMEYPLNNNSAGIRYSPEPALPVGPRDVSQFGNVPFILDQGSLALKAQANLGWADVSFLTSLSSDKQTLVDNNATGLAAPLYNGNLVLPGHSTYTELYIQSPGQERFRWIAGITYFTDNQTYNPLMLVQADLTSTATLNDRADDSVVSLDSALHNRSLAEYIQLSYAVTDQLKVTVGGRYTNEEQSVDIDNLVANGAPIPNASGSTTWRPFLPSGNIEYQVNSDLNVYAKVGKGFKSGLYAPTSLVPAAPEHITQYEVGAKSDVRSWLRVNVALYDSEYTDMQVEVRDPVTGVSTTENAAQSRIYGGELEVTAHPTDPLNVIAGLAWTHGRYLSYDAAAVTIPMTTGDSTSASCAYGTGTPIGGNRNATCNVSGNTLIIAPAITADLSAEYRWHLAGGQLALRGTANYEDSFFWDAFNRLEEPAKTLLDGELSWSTADKGFRVGLWSQNITNKIYNQSVTTSSLSDLGLRGQPRTVGVRFSQSLK